MKISFLELYGPSTSFKYPQFPNILSVHKSDILTKVGIVYRLTEAELKKQVKITSKN